MFNKWRAASSAVHVIAFAPNERVQAVINDIGIVTVVRPDLISITLLDAIAEIDLFGAQYGFLTELDLPPEFRENEAFKMGEFIVIRQPDHSMYMLWAQNE